MRVARWYCAKAQMTFSLLPDSMCAGMGGSLDEAERAVSLSEEVGVEEAAMGLRVDVVELPGALRWLRRQKEKFLYCQVRLLSCDVQSHKPDDPLFGT